MNMQSFIENKLDETNQLKVMRFALNKNQEDFGKLFGVSKQLIHLYESGKAIPTLTKWIDMKEEASHHGIELSDDVYQNFLELKAKSIMDDIRNKMSALKSIQEKRDSKKK